MAKTETIFIPAEGGEVLSIRCHLRELGVTDEEAIRYHMNFIWQTEQACGHKLDLRRYRPNPDNFLSPPMMG